MAAHAEISKSRSKTNPFKVRYVGKNGEIIATSELLSTKYNCKKNIKAIINMVDNGGKIPEKINNILVVDKTGKKVLKFEMTSSGYERKIY